MPFRQLNQTVRPCPLIARALEHYAIRVEVDRILPRESSEPESEYMDVDCSITAYPPDYGVQTDRSASLYFVKGRLKDGDVQLFKDQLENTTKLVDGFHHAGSPCTWVETHPHEPEWHAHVENCSLQEIGKILEAGGYR